MKITVRRKNLLFKPDANRIIARFLFMNENRAADTIRYVIDLSDKDASIAIKRTLRDFSMRHRNITKIFERHFSRISSQLTSFNLPTNTLTYAKKILIGAYFTMEYSIESTAFFNPSMVEHPDQTEIEPGAKRVIISFRATGEGHISSIVFRSGVLSKNNSLKIETIGSMLEEAEHFWQIYEKKTFARKLAEEQHVFSIIPPEMILDKLQDQFTYQELQDCILDAKRTIHLSEDKEVLFSKIERLATSQYELRFSLDTNISERVIFPVSANEKNGIEDARFVKFIDDNNMVKYFATYTAYDGSAIVPKLLETEDFYHFTVVPLKGTAAKNKGMALFPRKINGKYAMLCRIDGCNNYIAFSDNLAEWNDAVLIQKPKFAWELIQIGNCGSPIETKNGWLILTHGVGPMREYVMGATLLDLYNPEIEIGRLEYPLLIPNAIEREGYVPNVVYSCGSYLHGDDLIIPYAMSDYSSTYAIVQLQEIIDELLVSKQ